MISTARPQTQGFGWEVVSARAGATISINVMGGTGGFTSNIVDVVEWSGFPRLIKQRSTQGS